MINIEQKLAKLKKIQLNPPKELKEKLLFEIGNKQSMSLKQIIFSSFTAQKLAVGFAVIFILVTTLFVDHRIKFEAELNSYLGQIYFDQNNENLMDL